MAKPTPPVGHIHLVLYDYQQELFYLEIPVSVIGLLCLRPCKYLSYLGWCVLGNSGSLKLEDGDQLNPVGPLGELVDRGVYHYTLTTATLQHAVDPEVIRLRNQVSSQTTGTRENFRQTLIERDGDQCVWTSFPPGSAMHIIPFSRGEEWLKLIIANRPFCGERRLQNCTTNDIRNGIMGAVGLHTPHFESRAVVVLKTPNKILQMSDIPPGPERLHLGDTRYPTGSRYSLQWLIPAEGPRLHFFPNNADASFVAPHKSKPAETLLHYNYGAAAVKHWVRNEYVLRNRLDLPRPPVPQAAPLGPSQTIGDRLRTRGKLASARTETGKGGGGGDASSAAVEDSNNNEWDEDDIMIFFWGNSEVATKRYTKEKREREEAVNKWKAGVEG